jgi:elongation factor G
MADKHLGQLAFVRIYSGTVEAGSYVINTAKKNNKERVGRIMRMHANKREDIENASAGEIVAIAGMKKVTTGDTICNVEDPIILESIEFPDPVVQVAVEPKTRADQDKMGLALGRLAQEDPSFQVTTDIETGQTIIAGMGELHLDIIVDRMKREFGVEAAVGKPQVAYRETITRVAEGKEIFKKQSGGRGQFAHVELTIEPAPGEDFVFEDNIKGGAIPRQFIKPVSAGIKDAMARGYLAGYELVDIKATLTFGSFHEVDSDERSFQICGSLAFQNAVKRAKPVLLEPVMKVEVVTPEEYMGAVNGDLNRRRGQIEKMEPRPGNAQVITAYVPLSEMFGYTTDLRSSTQGRATSSMHFERYDKAPNNVAEEIIAKVQGATSS